MIADMTRREAETMLQRLRNATRGLAALAALAVRAIPVLWVVSGLAACGNPPATPTPPPLARELLVYNWEDYLPQSVIDAFTAEYGVKVQVETYDSMEEAVAGIQAGKAFDVAVLEDDELPELWRGGRLAEIDFRNVPNFKNVSANFRDLKFDPGNRHSVPYLWGTTGLLVRSDLVKKPVTRWADLWDPAYAGKVLVRAQPTELISVALKSLGYKLNTEQPAELEAALQRLRQLQPYPAFADAEFSQAVGKLLSGEAVIMVGWSGEAVSARRQNEAITYVVPQEGTMLWGDALVISAGSPNHYTAELFLNFILRPERGAQIISAYFYSSANEAAYLLVDATLAKDPLVNPPKDALINAEWYLPLSPAGQKLYADTWQRSMDHFQAHMRPEVP